MVRTIDRGDVQEGRPVTVHFEIGGLRALPVRVEVLGRGGEWHALEGGTGSVPFVIDRPGAHVLGPSPLLLRDDLGLFSRLTLGGQPESLLVLPEPAPPPARLRAGGALVAADPEPDGLRPYTPGTPMSRVHWASAARGGELQERHFTSGRDRLPLVVVDTAGAEGASLDWVARSAAGLVLALARAGGCRVLLPGDRVPTTLDDIGGWPAIHRRLAALEPGAPAALTALGDRDVLHVRAASAPRRSTRAAPCRPASSRCRVGAPPRPGEGRRMRPPAARSRAVAVPRRAGRKPARPRRRAAPPQRAFAAPPTARPHPPAARHPLGRRLAARRVEPRRGARAAGRRRDLRLVADVRELGAVGRADRRGARRSSRRRRSRRASGPCCSSAWVPVALLLAGPVAECRCARARSATARRSSNDGLSTIASAHGARLLDDPWALAAALLALGAHVVGGGAAVERGSGAADHRAADRRAPDPRRRPAREHAAERRLARRRGAGRDAAVGDARPARARAARGRDRDASWR